jgi:hypothetical protein
MHTTTASLTDLLPLLFCAILFIGLMKFLSSKKTKDIKIAQKDYESARNHFFDNIPAKEILTLEDFQTMKKLISSSEMEGVYLLLSKNIIEEQAHASEEVQFQLKTFLDKALPIISSIDNEDENKPAIVNEFRKLFNLYANKETRKVFQDKKILHVKY